MNHMNKKRKVLGVVGLERVLVAVTIALAIAWFVWPRHSNVTTQPIPHTPLTETFRFSPEENEDSYCEYAVSDQYMTGPCLEGVEKIISPNQHLLQENGVWKPDMQFEVTAEVKKTEQQYVVPDLTPSEKVIDTWYVSKVLSVRAVSTSSQ